MTTDQEHADVLARMVQVGMPEDEQAAIERAIKLLEREADAQDAFESGAYQ